MISIVNCRRAALLSFAILFASCVSSFGQAVTTKAIPKAKRDQLLTTGEAGSYRSILLNKLGGRVEATGGVSENYSLIANGKSISCDLVSELVSLKSGNIEQITIKITEAGSVREFNLVQYANGDLGTLEGDKLVTYSLSNNSSACLDAQNGQGPSCTACRNKLNTCFGNNRVVRIIGCLLKNFDGSCISCGYQVDVIVACVLER